MLSEIVKEMDAIYDLSGFIAILDIILSLATVDFFVVIEKEDEEIEGESFYLFHFVG